MGFEPVRGVTYTYIIFYKTWRRRGSPVVAMKTGRSEGLEFKSHADQKHFFFPNSISLNGFS